jgi:hypothetical protein
VQGLIIGLVQFKMLNMKRLLQTAFVSLILSVSFQQAMAQNPAIMILSDLSFGSTTTTKTIAYTDAAAAHFQVQFPTYSQAGTVSFTFILPTNLTDVAGNNLPISFATNSAAYHVDVNSTTGATTFDPNAGLSGTLGQAAHTDYFWLGGTVTPPRNFTASDYSGIVTVSVNVTIGTQNYSATQTITVTAKLLGKVSLSATGSLNFGFVVAGTTPPSLSALAGGAPQFVATGVRNNRSIVTFSATTTLNDVNGNTLTFTPSVYGSGTNNQVGSVPITSGSTLNTGNNTNHNYYFWLGGSLNAVPSGQPPGSYTGAFVLTVVR